MGLKKEIVEFKGTRYGLTVVCNDKVDFEDLVSALRERLEGREGAFFAGASVMIDMGNRSLTAREAGSLWQAFEDNGLYIKCLLTGDNKKSILGGTNSLNRTQENGGYAGHNQEKLPTLVITRNIRSGQDITYPGNVIVFGDVKPGSKITVSGFILVLGSLMGTAHAGAEGDENAWVAALSLQPTQLRIAGYITRAPDEKPVEPEIARIYKGSVVVSEWKKANFNLG